MKALPLSSTALIYTVLIVLAAPLAGYQVQPVDSIQIYFLILISGQLQNIRS